jgi:hypothetical protein
MKRRGVIAGLVALLALPHRSTATGTCPNRASFTRKLENPVMRLLLNDLEAYRGPVIASVYAMQELWPPGGIIGFGGHRFQFREPNSSDPDFPFLWKIVPECIERGTL